jgi:hypothetical protein
MCQKIIVKWEGVINGKIGKLQTKQKTKNKTKTTIQTSNTRYLVCRGAHPLCLFALLIAYFLPYII